MSTVSRTPIGRYRPTQHRTIRTLLFAMLAAVLSGLLLAVPSSDAAGPLLHPPCGPAECLYQPDQIVSLNKPRPRPVPAAATPLQLRGGVPSGRQTGLHRVATPPRHDGHRRRAARG